MYITSLKILGLSDTVEQDNYKLQQKVVKERERESDKCDMFCENILEWVERSRKFIICHNMEWRLGYIQQNILVKVEGELGTDSFAFSDFIFIYKQHTATNKPSPGACVWAPGDRLHRQAFPWHSSQNLSWDRLYQDIKPSPGTLFRVYQRCRLHTRAHNSSLSGPRRGRPLNSRVAFPLELLLMPKE